ERRLLAEANLALRPAGLRAHVRPLRAAGADDDRKRAVEGERAQPVAPRLEARVEPAASARRNELLGDDVGRHAGAADAELDLGAAADRGDRPERHLDRAVEVGGEVDQAGVAVEPARDGTEGLLGRGRAAAQRAEQLPAKLEQSVPGGLEAELQRLAPTR